MPDISSLWTTYQPSTIAVAGLPNVTLAAAVGPSCVGKSTVIAAAIKRDPQLHLVVVDTSRAPRPGERDGIDYHFRSRESMLARLERHEYVQIAPSVLGELYATAPESYEGHGVAIMAVLGEAIAAFRAMPFREVRTIFVVPPDYATWQTRMGSRSFSAKQREQRLAEAERSYHFALQDKATQIVINGDLATAAMDFQQLALREPLSPRLQADQLRGRQIIEDMLQQLANTQ